MLTSSNCRQGGAKPQCVDQSGSVPAVCREGGLLPTDPQETRGLPPVANTLLFKLIRAQSPQEKWLSKTHFHSPTKRNLLLSHEDTQRDPKCTLLILEGSPSEKATSCDSRLWDGAEKAELWGQKKDRCLPGEGRRARTEDV